MHAAIVGAGDLGGATAAALAVQDRCRVIQLIDETGTVSAGKALDIQQAGSIHRSAARLVGTPDLGAASRADVIVLADRPGVSDGEWSGEAGLALVRRILGVNAHAPLVCAAAAHAWLIEHAVAELGLDWTRIVGAAPLAFEAAVRGLVALEAATAPSSVAVTLAGTPPDSLIVGWESATIDGAPATSRLDPQAIAQLTRRVPFLWPPGPLALAAAAAQIVDGLLRGAHRPYAALVALPRPGLPRRRAVIASVHLGRGRVTRAALADLSPQAQVALDNLLAR